MDKKTFISCWPEFSKNVPFLSGNQAFTGEDNNALQMSFEQLDAALSAQLAHLREVELTHINDLLIDIIKEGLRK